MCSQACLREMEKFWKDSIRSLLVAAISSHHANCSLTDSSTDPNKSQASQNSMLPSPTSTSSNIGNNCPTLGETRSDQTVTSVESSSPVPSTSSLLMAQCSPTSTPFLPMVEMTASILSDILSNLSAVKSNRHQALQQTSSTPTTKVKRRRRRKRYSFAQKQRYLQQNVCGTTDNNDGQLKLQSDLSVKEIHEMAEVNHNINSPNNEISIGINFLDGSGNLKDDFHSKIIADKIGDSFIGSRLMSTSSTLNSNNKSANMKADCGNNSCSVKPSKSSVICDYDDHHLGLSKRKYSSVDDVNCIDNHSNSGEHETDHQKKIRIEKKMGSMNGSGQILENDKLSPSNVCISESYVKRNSRSHLAPSSSQKLSSSSSPSSIPDNCYTDCRDGEKDQCSEITQQSSDPRDKLTELSKSDEGFNENDLKNSERFKQFSGNNNGIKNPETRISNNNEELTIERSSAHDCFLLSKRNSPEENDHFKEDRRGPKKYHDPKKTDHSKSFRSQDTNRRNRRDVDKDHHRSIKSKSKDWKRELNRSRSHSATRTRTRSRSRSRSRSQRRHRSKSREGSKSDRKHSDLRHYSRSHSHSSTKGKERTKERFNSRSRSRSLSERKTSRQHNKDANERYHHRSRKSSKGQRRHRTSSRSSSSYSASSRSSSGSSSSKCSSSSNSSRLSSPISKSSKDSIKSRSKSRSLSIRRRGSSPNFLERRRITSARKRPTPYHRDSPSSDSSSSSSSPSSHRKRTHSSRSCSSSSSSSSSTSSSSSSKVSPCYYYIRKSRSPSP